MSKDIDVSFLKNMLNMVLENGLNSKDTDKSDVDISPKLLGSVTEYLILSLDCGVDQDLLLLIEKLTQRIYKEHEFEEEYVKEYRVASVKDYIEKKHKLAIYEMHKIISTDQVAGETSFENLINNIKMRGVEVARKFRGKEYLSKFTTKEIKKIAKAGIKLRKEILNKGMPLPPLGEN